MAKILVVDDEIKIIEYLTAILSEAGHEVFAATDGNKALGILNRHEIDLIVADIIMPDMEGIEFIGRVKKQKPQIKIIAVSGGGIVDAEIYLKMAFTFGADKILKKPFKPDQVLELILQLQR